MNYQSEAFMYILKQYSKGKKDNINFILISLRQFVLDKCNKFELKNEQIKVLIKYLIEAIDTYSFEKSISFIDYIDIYLDISLNSYLKENEVESLDFYDNEFFDFFIKGINESILEEKTKIFKIN